MEKEKDRRVKIEAKTIIGDTRSYEFLKIHAIVGVRIVHEYGSVVMSNMDSIKGAFSAYHGDKLNGTPMSRMINLFGLIPKVITWNRLQELSRELLAGGSVDGVVLDDDGMCDLFGEDPFELYAALFWALTVNYPKYFGPLLQALEEGADDTTLDSDVAIQ